MIYLDNAATTAPNKEALRIATQKYEELFYNPSASYKQGAEVHALIEDCKRTILETLVNEEDIADYDIIFTGSGTEADNLALRHVDPVFCNLLSTLEEHAAVYEAALTCTYREPKKVLCVEGDTIKPSYKFVLTTDEIAPSINKGTALVSVIHVGNETGKINDIQDIARKVKKVHPLVLFHSDGVQAYGKIPFKLTPEIDMYSISAHKIGGIKGIGALVYRKEVRDRLRPIIYGGGQGNGLRSGTENVLGIIDFAEAVKKWAYNGYSFNRGSFYDRVEYVFAAVAGIKELLWFFLAKDKFVRISPEDGSPYILTVSAKGKNNEVIQKILEEKYGILVGIGSACSSNHAKNKGRVLRALGYGDDIINGALRFSFSPQTTVEEIRTAAKAVNEVVWSLS